MSKKKPSHADAHLVLELYDLRREPVMRESRKTLGAWFPKTFDDVVAITKPDDPRNAAWRQVSSYFEMAYGFARHGIVPADFLVENAAEGLFLYAKLEPHLKQFRKQFSPTAFRNAEWIVKKSKVAQERMKLWRKRIATVLAAQQRDAEVATFAAAQPPEIAAAGGGRRSM